MRKILYILLGFIFALSLTAYAAPSANTNILRNTIPETDNTYDLGTSTNTWKNLWLFNSSGAVRCLQIGTTGQVAIASGACGSGSGGGGSDVNWTFFNTSGISVATTTNQVVIGASATTTLNKLEVYGNLWLKHSLAISTTSPMAALSVSTTTSNLPLALFATSTNVTAFMIDGNGKVGIGTTSPGTMLSLGNSASFINFSPAATSTFANGIISAGLFSSNGITNTAGNILNTTTGTTTVVKDLTTTGLLSSGGLTLSGGAFRLNNQSFTNLLGTGLLNTNGALTLDTTGTWSGNAGTASALAANGTNCTAGNYPLGVDASGVSENCTPDVAFSTTSANYLLGGFTSPTLSFATLIGTSTASSTMNGGLSAKGLDGASYVKALGGWFTNIYATSSINLLGVADGCATFTSSALSSTGTSCGSGSGSGFSTTTNNYWHGSQTSPFLSAAAYIGTSTATSTFNGGLSTKGHDAGAYIKATQGWFDQIFATTSATSTFVGGISTAGLSSSNGLDITGGLKLSSFNCSGNANGGKLTTDSTGRVSCADDTSSAGGAGNPGGVTTQLQYNNGGAFGGANSTSWDNLNGLLGVGSSTPWAYLSVGTSTINLSRPLLSIATSSNASNAGLTSLVVDNNGKVGIGTSTPSTDFSVQGSALISNILTVVNPNATSTIGGSLLVNNSRINSDWNTGTTSIQNLYLSNQSFDYNAGSVNWVDLPLTGGTAGLGTLQMYTANLNGNPELTIGGTVSAANTIGSTSVSVGTTTGSGHFNIWGEGTGSGLLFSMANAASTTLLAMQDKGLFGLGTTTPTADFSVNAQTSTTTLMLGSKAHPYCVTRFSTPSGNAFRTYLTDAGVETTEAGSCTK